MGQIVKQVSPHSTRYYWYPGEKKEWLRSVAALVAGFAVFGALHLFTKHTLLAAVVGTSVTAAIAGVNFGMRDSRELARFGEIAEKAARRQAVVHTGRAVWRGFAEGTGGAAAAIIIVNLANRGILADWILPLVPAAVGALAHQIGMMYERLSVSKSIAGPANVAAATKPAGAATKPASSLGAPVPVPVALLKPNKSIRPPMPASVALLELAEAHKAERAQAARDAASAAGRPASVSESPAASPLPPAPAPPAPANIGAHAARHSAKARNEGPARSHRATGRHVGRASVAG